MSSLLTANFATFLSVLTALGVAYADTDTQNARGEEIEEVEEIENIDVIEPTTTGTEGAKSASLTVSQFVAHTHPVFVHLPLGFVIAVTLLELLALIAPRLPLGRSSLVLSIATVASFFPAMISGYLRANELYAGRAPPEIFVEHRLLIFTAAGIFIASLILRLARKDDLSGRYRIIYLLLLVAAVFLFASGGHHGGMLVYGENFLRL